MVLDFLILFTLGHLLFFISRSPASEIEISLYKFPLWVAPSLTPLVELRKPIPTSHIIDWIVRICSQTNLLLAYVLVRYPFPTSLASS